MRDEDAVLSIATTLRPTPDVLSLELSYTYIVPRIEKGRSSKIPATILAKASLPGSKCHACVCVRLHVYALHRQAHSQIRTLHAYRMPFVASSSRFWCLMVYASPSSTPNSTDRLLRMSRNTEIFRYIPVFGMHAAQICIHMAN